MSRVLSAPFLGGAQISEEMEASTRRDRLAVHSWRLAGPAWLM